MTVESIALQCERAVPAFLGEYLTGHDMVAAPALWWERFGGPYYRVERGCRKAGADKGEWVRHLAQQAAGKASWRPALERQACRIANIARSAGPTARVFDLRLRTRLALGLGLSHPTENGMLFHPTLGCPYIPGSSLKGLTQAFADEWLRKIGKEAGEEGRRISLRIFGQSERLRGEARYDEGETRRGSVIFFDAVPLTWPKIGVDIMTPHIGKYLTGDENVADTIATTPIYFASVAPGATFQFAVAPAYPVTGCDDGWSDCALAAGWLECALKKVGAGAKTKSDYGRFE
jgi:CRISPR-associated protein Cmr6